MRVDKIDTYEQIDNGVIRVLNCHMGISINTGILNRESEKHREQLREVANHILSYVNTGSLVISTTVKDIIDMRQQLIDDGCLTDFNGTPIGIKDIEVYPTVGWCTPPIVIEPKPDG